MENATQALLIAAGVLIGIMILSLGVALYSELNSYVESTKETIDFNELNRFNTQFTKYINYVGNKEQFELTIQDIVTAANCAYQNNIQNEVTEDKRGNENYLYVAVYLNGEPIEQKINKEASDMLTANLVEDKKIKFKCTGDDVKFSKLTGRVYAIYFKSEEVLEAQKEELKLK